MNSSSFINKNHASVVRLLALLTYSGQVWGEGQVNL